MYKFSRRSLKQLGTCHKDLQRLFHTVIKYRDCAVLEGFRGKQAQDKKFDEGYSKLQWPYGNHNQLPSRAVDVVPYPIKWREWERNANVELYEFIGFVRAIAATLKIDVISGIDWDGDLNFIEHSFLDFPHWQLGKAVIKTKEPVVVGVP